jgi:hypothetical protein
MSTTSLRRPIAGVTLAACAALALGTTGCGSSSGGDENADPAKVVPSGAPIYLEVTVRPQGAQKVQVTKLLREVMRTNDPGARIAKLVNASSGKLDFNKDVQPWLGRKIGVFFTTFSGGANGAAIVATKDTGKAKAALDKDAKTDGKPDKKGSYKGVDYTLTGSDAQGIVGNYAVSGTLSAFKSVVDTQKDSGKALTAAPNFTQARRKLGSGGLAFLYADPSGLVSAIASSSSIPPTVGPALRQAAAQIGASSAAAKVSAVPEAFVIDAAVLGLKPSATPSGDAPAALAKLPADSWLGVGIGALGPRGSAALKQAQQLSGLGGIDLNTVLKQLTGGLDIQNDLLSWMGDAGIFIRGTSLGDLGVGVEIQSTNAAKSKAAVGKIAKLIRLKVKSAKVVPYRGGGFDAAIAVVPAAKTASAIGNGVVIGDKGSTFVIAFGTSGVSQALKPTATLDSNPDLKKVAEKLGDVRPELFFSMSPFLTFLEGVGIGSRPGYVKARPYLQQFTAITAGAKREGGVARARLVIGVR